MFRCSVRAVLASLALLVVCLSVVGPALGVVDPVPAPGPVASGQAAVQHGVEAQQLRLEQDQNRAMMPEAIEERRQSASAYEDLSGSEAADVLQDAQPHTVIDATWPKVDLAPGQDMNLVSTTRAEIQNPDGSTDLAQSTQPMGYVDAGGDLQPLDLDLQNSAAGFSVADSPVATALPDRLDDPLAIGSGESKVELAPAGAAAVAGVRRGTGVFYANIDPDTDLFVKPVLGGLETFHVLRSAQSPETVSVDLALSSGGAPVHLVADASTGGAALMTDAGAVARISAAKAIDADGTAVAVTMSVEGATVSLHVAHRGADLHYPITVDPVYVNVNSGCWDEVSNHQGCEVDLWETDYNDSYGNGSGAGWNYTENDPHGLINAYFSTNTQYLGMGLTIAETGYNHFDDGEGGNWWLGAPDEVVIYKAGFYNVSTDNWDNDSCAFTGLRRADLSWDNGVKYVGGCSGQTLDEALPGCWNGAAPTQCVAPSNPASAMYGNRIWFGSITNQGPAFGWTHGFTHVMGGAIAIMHDYLAPRVSYADPGGSGSVQVTLGDFGLGMKRWSIASNGTVVDSWDDNTQPAGVPRCSGGITRFVCPHDRVAWVSRCGMHSGTNIIAISATDVSGNILTDNRGVYVDPAVSGFSISGELPAVAGAPVEQDSYGLHVDARSPCGISQLATWVEYPDGSRHDLPAIPAASGNFTIDALSYVGTYTLHIDAQNGQGVWLGQQTLSFTVLDSDNTPEFEAQAPSLADGALGTWDAGVLPTDAAQHAFSADRSIASSPTDVIKDASGATRNIPVSSADNPWLGISDQTHQSFTDPNLLGLRVTRVRRIVAYDLVASGQAAGCPGYDQITDADAVNVVCLRLKQLDLWMKHNNGVANTRVVDGMAVEPLVSFEHSDGRLVSRKVYATANPSESTYVQDVQAFMDRYPNVKAFAPWNEPNHSSQPYHDKPALAGRLFGLMYNICQAPARACQVVAGDFSDGMSLTSGYLQQYELGVYGFSSSLNYLKLIGVWAIHLHSSVQYRSGGPTAGSQSFVKQFMMATSPQTKLWITEVGAFTKVNTSKGSLDYTAHPGWTNVTLQNIINTAQSWPRITRVYYYQWRGDPIWDSGLVDRYPTTDPDQNPQAFGTPRPYIFPLFRLITDAVRLHPRLTQAPSGTSSSPSATVAFVSDEAPDSYQCRLDVGTWTDCVSPVTYNNLVSGAHTVDVRSVMTLGRTPDGSTTTDLGYALPLDSTDTASASWSVDATAPDTTIASQPPASTTASSATFAFAGTDNVGVTGYECKLDSGTWAVCSSPKAYGSLAAGSHTFAVRAEDAAGNVDGSPSSVTWTVDTTAPDTSISSSPPSPTNATSASIAFSGIDNVAVASYECQLDAAAWAACSSPKAYGSLAAGSHTFAVRAQDGAGNVDATPATVNWTIDTTAPDTMITSAPTGSTTATSASIAFTGTDNVLVASYECQLDAGSWSACTSPKSYSSLTVGSHTVQARAKDSAGNVDASAASATWTVTAAGGSVVLGNQSIETIQDSNSAGDIEAFAATATGTGPAASISVYLDSSSTGAVAVGLYTDASGKPGRLLSFGSVASPNAGGWTTVALNGRPQVTSGTAYQLAVMSVTGGLRFRDRSSGPCTSRVTHPGGTTPPKLWGVETWSGASCPASMYLTTGTADSTAPDTTISAQPPATTTSTAASFTFSGTDDYAVTGYECQLDAGTWTACSSPRGYASLATGSHTFKVRAKDAAANVDATPATATWTVGTGGATPVVLGGNQTVESHPDPINGWLAEAWPMVASATGTAGTVSVWVDTSSAANDLQISLYSNNAGLPGTLLAAGSTSTPTAGAWATIALSGSASITSGTTYWLGVTSSDYGLVLRDRTGGTCTAHATNTPLGGFPTTWTTDIYTATQCPPSIYLKSN